MGKMMVNRRLEYVKFVAIVEDSWEGKKQLWGNGRPRPEGIVYIEDENSNEKTASQKFREESRWIVHRSKRRNSLEKISHKVCFKQD